MMHGGEIMQLTCCFDYVIDPWITELNNFSGFDIYKMVMLTALICFLKLSYVLSKLMLDNKIALK